jgi:hypothetical protein
MLQFCLFLHLGLLLENEFVRAQNEKKEKKGQQRRA